MILKCIDCGRAFEQALGRPAPRCDACKRERKRVTDSAKGKRWRESNLDHARELQRQSYHRTKGSVTQQAARLRYGLQRYGLTPAEYLALAEAQEHRCAICGHEHRGIGRRLHVDHDHSTGRNRALLCGLCNALLGQAEDSPDRLRAAADYIERHH